jgi:hypothetical protein
MAVQELQPVAIHSDAHRSIVHQIADMHAERLKAGFLPLLGRAMLARIYRHAVRDPDAILLATVDGDRVLGFVMGAVSTRNFYAARVTSLLAVN